MAVVALLATTALTAWLIAGVARRVIGAPVGWPRTILVSALFPTVGSAAANALVRALGTMDEDGGVRDVAGTAAVVVLVWAWLFVVLLAVLYVAEIVVPTGSLPGPITLVRRWYGTQQETKRYLQLLVVLVRRGLGGFLRRGAWRGNGDAHTVGARLRDALGDAGVTYVKLGQMLSARRDLVPAGIADELATLQSDAAPLDWPEIAAALENSLGGPVAEFFAEIDRTPLAAASVGQVHAARLTDGTSVVVKVQRPGARTQVDRDLRILRRLARRVQRDAAWARDIGVVDLVEGFATSLHEELDYTVELDNMRNLAAATGDSPIVIPTPYPELSSRTVLVTNRVRGTPVGSAGPFLALIDLAVRRDAAATLLAQVLRQILVVGVFHADLHPGNVLVAEDGTLALLDFGAVGRLDETERLAIAALLLAIDNDDSVAATDGLLTLLGTPDGFARRDFERRFGQLIVRYRNGFGSGGSGALFGDMVRLITGAGFAIPGQIAGVFRTLASLEGTLLLLDPGFDLMTAAREGGGGVLTEIARPERLAARAQGQLLTSLPVLQRLPSRIDALTADLADGRFTVGTRMFDHPEDRAFVTGLVQRVITALIAVSCLLGAVVLLVQRDGPYLVAEVPATAVLGGFLGLAGGILALRSLMR
ncbi:ABC1 kinase family protein [Nocardia puris]|uniref:Ubiquinone biosynthesis protein n=1 Tax=Nocardia puris TaxID=208602 RepID=A0A366E2W2_9NOCA|nr:AarF/UbiB family protein [Nocardia puris]RBO96662.1 ubiquinone biosynthesis protein [Nocardia puris]